MTDVVNALGALNRHPTAEGARNTAFDAFLPQQAGPCNFQLNLSRFDVEYCPINLSYLVIFVSGLLT